MTPEELQTRILHRDASVLVIDKPAGLPVHPGPKGGETLADHLESLRFGLPRKPELAHRLDRDTSGCLALGRHRQALIRLNRLFRDGAVRKVYRALVERGPVADAGTMDYPLAPRSPERGWWMKVDENGLPSRTSFRALARIGDRTLLELEPETGRTHQLRVHCAAAGFPIVGDAIYGTGVRGGERLLLHAHRLIIPYAPRRPPIEVEAPLPMPLVVPGWGETAASEAKPILS